MKRANDPIFWSLFGAGGMFSALFGPVLIFITGIAVPFGFILSRQTMSYAHMMAFTHNPIGKLFVLAVIALFLFHGGHRLLHSLHDFGIHGGPREKVYFYSIPIVATVVSVVLLLAIGF
jgi:fumarate reductase subunit D